MVTKHLMFYIYIYYNNNNNIKWVFAYLKIVKTSTQYATNRHNLK
jgi:hypothetical protein